MDERVNRRAIDSPAKHDLLKALLQQTGHTFNAFALSSAQQRLWFLDQLQPNSPLYNLPAALRLSGPLNLIALAGSLSAIMQRHEALRTTFMVVAEQPVQYIATAVRLPLPVLDLRGLPLALREVEAQRLARHEAQRPFNLAEDRLLRTILLRLDADEHVLLLTMHHIIADGWSIGVFVRDLAALYAAAVDGRSAALPALPIQYADYAAWQREQLDGDALDAQLAYWQHSLAGAPPVLELPTDHPRPATPTIRGGRHPLIVPAAVTAGLAELSQRAQVTLFMTLLAAFQILLTRYTDQQDLVVGTPIANRTRAETEGVIGCFVNTLVLRTDQSGNPTFHELLTRVRAVCLAAYTHQNVPFEHLVQVLHAERDLRHMPLFQVLFALQNAPMPPLELAGLTVHMQDLDSGTAKCDLTLSLEERPEGVIGWFEYAADLFEPPTIARLAGHWLTLLHGIVADPAQRLAERPLLSDAERDQLLALWPTAPASRVAACLHQLFAEQAARTPDAIALVFEGTKDEGRTTKDVGAQYIVPSPSSIVHRPSSIVQLTYAELDRRSNQLARHLRALSVGPEVCVGLCVERSIELVVGLLGILKAGGAYVPIDPAYPAERMAFMLKDARVAVLITKATDDRRWTMDDEGTLIDGLIVQRMLSIQNPKSKIQNPKSDNLAYVIYTSGSTGTPKGVLVSHANVVRLLTAAQPWVSAGASDVWTLFHSAAFDFSVWELWGALAYGGRLVIVARETTRAPEALISLLDQERVTVLNQTPSAFYPLVQALATDQRLPSLRRIIFGGEALELTRLRPWFDRPGEPAAQLVNMYGITETTVHVTARRITAADVRGATGSLIGGPLTDLRVYVLDSLQKLVPLGVPGELYVGGAGVARGYLGRPALTAERFIPNPFLKDEGGRMRDEESQFILHPSSFILYATGDRARWLPNGDIEYLGRADQQVKLRGYRIELGEIEAALRAQPAVQDAVVIAREDQPGERRLVAYVVQGPGTRGQGSGSEDKETRKQGDKENPNVSLSAPRPATRDPRPLIPDLRAFLATRLPDYMIPAAFVALDALPLTPSGKVDRRALPAPVRPATDDSFVGPRTAQEELLAGIWGDVLRLERVGIHDNFFALGGHSLLATQLMVRVRETFRVELPVRALFEAPTIAALAEQIALARQGTPAIMAPPILPVARGGMLPLTYAQQQLWFVQQLDALSTAYTIAAAVQLSGPLNQPALAQSLTAIVERHEILRTTFPSVDGTPIQRIASATPVLLPMRDLRALPPVTRAAEAQRLARYEAQRPFDLVADRLLRTMLLRLDADEHVLLLTMHHIIADGWSIGIFVRDLAALYSAFVNDIPARLPDLPIQYADFAQWQREWLQGDQLASQLNYWRAQLGGNLPNLELIGDRPRPAVQTFRGAHLDVAIHADLTAALIDLSQRERVTLFMTLLATFTTLLARYAQQDDIPIGTTVANRARSAVEGLIGPFINTLVLRADLSGNPRFCDLARRVREVALDAYAHQDVPFEQLVEALQPVRDMSRNPLVQVVFVLQNAPMPALEFASLRLRPTAIDSETSQFDLTLNLVDRQGSLDGWFEYNTDLFDAATIMRMASHFQTLLEGVVANPEQRLAELPLLSEREQRQLLVEWNATERAYPLDDTLHQVFAAQAIATPDAIAVIFEAATDDLRDNETRRQGDEEIPDRTTNDGSAFSVHPSAFILQMTYAELDRRSNQLAHRLRALGVGPEVRVGICMERSLELVIALLGILKAGGAYVPLDPTYPAERLTFMLTDARVSVLITPRGQGSGTGGQDGRVPSSDPWPLTPDPWTVVDLRADWPIIAAAPAHPPDDWACADNLAYAIYTSGSTGQPKGVLGTHRATLNCFYWMWTTYPFAPGEICAQKTSLSFGDSIQELFGPLLRGVPLVLIPEALSKDPERLCAALARHAVTRIVLVPALLHAILDTPAPLAYALSR